MTKQKMHNWVHPWLCDPTLQNFLITKHFQKSHLSNFQIQHTLQNHCKQHIRAIIPYVLHGQVDSNPFSSYLLVVCFFQLFHFHVPHTFEIERSNFISLVFRTMKINAIVLLFKYVTYMTFHVFLMLQSEVQEKIPYINMVYIIGVIPSPYEKQQESVNFSIKSFLQPQINKRKYDLNVQTIASTPLLHNLCYFLQELSSFQLPTYYQI